MVNFSPEVMHGYALLGEAGSKWVGEKRKLFQKYKVHKAANKLLSVASPFIEEAYRKSGESNSMSLRIGQETIFEREDPVPGTDIYAVAVKHVVSSEDYHDHSQTNFDVWSGDRSNGEKSTIYFEQVDFGTPTFVGMIGSSAGEALDLKAQKALITDVIKAVKSVQNQPIIKNSG